MSWQENGIGSDIRWNEATTELLNEHTMMDIIRCMGQNQQSRENRCQEMWLLVRKFMNLATSNTWLESAEAFQTITRDIVHWRLSGVVDNFHHVTVGTYEAFLAEKIPACDKHLQYTYIQVITCQHHRRHKSALYTGQAESNNQKMLLVLQLS